MFVSKFYGKVDVGVEILSFNQNIPVTNPTSLQTLTKSNGNIFLSIWKKWKIGAGTFPVLMMRCAKYQPVAPFFKKQDEKLKSCIVKDEG